MELRLLGEMQVWSAGRLLDLGTPRQQAVLAALVVDARRPVAIQTLAARVWDDAPPTDPRAVLYSHLSRIRRLLRQAADSDGEEAVPLERRHAGYVLDLDPERVDLHRFRRLVDLGGGQRQDEATRAAALTEALGMWRGTPLAGLPGEWAAQVRDSLRRRRLDAVVRWAQLELHLGRPNEVVTALADLVAEYPLVEPLETLLMRALYTTGRGAEALDRYSAVRRRLADGLGTEPGPELRALHQALLHDDLPPPVPAGAVRTLAPPRPRSTPPPPARAEPPDDATSPATPPATPPVTPSRTPSGTPPRHPRRWRWRSRTAGRRALLATAIVVVLSAAVLLGSSASDDDVDVDPTALDRAQALFADAARYDRDGRTREARAAVVDAARLYGELIEQDPGRHAPPLASAVVEALIRAGVDSSVPGNALREWLANPAFTPYPAIAQVILARGWQLRDPVFLDVIVANYEQAPGVASPRAAADVDPGVLRAAIVEGSNSRHGTRVTEFERLLVP
ncbi:AfsR/SARP family transcriptional regulator [Streptomyces sp. 4N509B]|uniref:AfsR/SARP family transcriptional regulator n=1 Tax=Streptomyces sp. 4N509B TaxID=3457413 RepID=UPI003FCFF564